MQHLQSLRSRPQSPLTLSQLVAEFCLFGRYWRRSWGLCMLSAWNKQPGSLWANTTCTSESLRSCQPSAAGVGGNGRESLSSADNSVAHLLHLAENCPRASRNCFPVKSALTLKVKEDPLSAPNPQPPCPCLDVQMADRVPATGGFIISSCCLYS